MIQQTSKVN